MKGECKDMMTFLCVYIICKSIIKTFKIIEKVHDKDVWIVTKNKDGSENYIRTNKKELMKRHTSSTSE